MKIAENITNLVLNNFPKFELSYEIITHKKVYNSDIILAIPEGIKYFAWFTTDNFINVCYLLEVTNNKISNIKQIKVNFDESLSLGTIFYGTLFIHNGISCFCIEDIYYYKSKNYIHVSYLTKLELLGKIMNSELTQNILNNTFTLFGLPIIHTDFSVLLQHIQLLPYKISNIKYRFFNKNNCRKIISMTYFKPGLKNVKQNITKDVIKRAIFKITANIEPDIYNLFTDNDEYFDKGFIPDYKTSVMMNNLFRKIKENDNIDAIEESDDEEEFENSNVDKFVYLEKSYKMNCDYNHKFKRWVPINLADENSKLVLASQLRK
jgi:hypothetical protein